MGNTNPPKGPPEGHEPKGDNKSSEHKAIQCLECHRFFPTDISLHMHLKRHKMSQGTYYIKHFPRYDKIDGSPIVFKNRESYFTSDFNSRSNLKVWLEQADAGEARQYVVNALKDRMQRKGGGLYTPCQVELRSLPMPGIVYIQRRFGGYYEMAERLGYRNRFSQLEFDTSQWKRLSGEHRVVIDTREQEPLVFKGVPILHKALPFGDYALNDEAFTQKLVIERKAVADFYNTMSNGMNRFNAELHKTFENGYYMVILVETPFDVAWGYSQDLKRMGVSISPEYIFYHVRYLLQKHPNIQFLFVANREEAANIILKLFRCNGQYRNVDLQYAYDSGTLTGAPL